MKSILPCALALALALAFALAACRKPTPTCAADPDAGPVVETPCIGKKDGEACCLGSVSGVCAAARCDVGGSP